MSGPLRLGQTARLTIDLEISHPSQIGACSFSNRNWENPFSILILILILILVLILILILDLILIPIVQEGRSYWKEGRCSEQQLCAINLASSLNAIQLGQYNTVQVGQYNTVQYNIARSIQYKYSTIQYKSVKLLITRWDQQLRLL